LQGTEKEFRLHEMLPECALLGYVDTWERRKI